MTLRSLALLLLAVPCAQAAGPPARLTYDPLRAYCTQTVRGWTVNVHQGLFDPRRDDLRRSVLEELDNQLYRIARAVPAGPLARLRQVPIWVELAHPRHPCMCYHPSADWLLQHDMHPRKAGAVEIASARNFLAWSHAQPWMVLHELAHAYHHQVLGFDHAAVRAAWQQAMRDKLYGEALHANGGRRRHYAATNEKEFFAETTEAFFGTNDFYPFVRAELKRHDPRAHDLMEKLWGAGGPARKR